MGSIGHSGTEVQELTALCEKAFGSVGQKAEVTHAHEAFGDHMEQEAADEFVSIERHGLFLVVIFSVPVTEGDLAVMD